MPSIPAPPVEFDTAWKFALEAFFESFLALAFPAVHELVNWRVAPVFLDTELQRITRLRRKGKRTADKLVRVRMRDGRDQWIFVHVEVQAQRDREFAQRMWTYYYRIVDRHGPNVISLAVLADPEANWKPESYQSALGGCRVRFEFPTFKVIEQEQPEAEFERTNNPFALLVAAHQAALRTRRNAEQRYHERLRLVRYLYRKGLSRETVYRLFQAMAALTVLPPQLEQRFDTQLDELEKQEKTMLDEPIYLLPRQRRAFEEKEREGRLEGQKQFLLDALETRFGKVPVKARRTVQALDDAERLRQAHRLAITAPTIEEFLKSF